MSTNPHRALQNEVPAPRPEEMLQNPTKRSVPSSEEGGPQTPQATTGGLRSYPIHSNQTAQDQAAGTLDMTGAQGPKYASAPTGAAGLAASAGVDPTVTTKSQLDTAYPAALGVSQMNAAELTADKVAAMADLAAQAALEALPEHDRYQPTVVVTDVVLPGAEKHATAPRVPEYTSMPSGEEAQRKGERIIGETTARGKEVVSEAAETGKQAVGTAAHRGREAVGVALQTGQHIVDAAGRTIKQTAGIPEEQALGPALAHKAAEAAQIVPEKASRAVGAVTGIVQGTTEVATKAAASAAGSAAGTAAGAATSVTKYTAEVREAALQSAMVAVEYPVRALLTLFFLARDSFNAVLTLALQTTDSLYRTASYTAGAGAGLTEGALCTFLVNSESFENGRQHWVHQPRAIARKTAVTAESLREATLQRQRDLGVGGMTREAVDKAQQAGQEAIGSMAGATQAGQRALGMNLQESQQETLGYGHGFATNLGRVQEGAGMKSGYPAVPVPGVQQATDAVRGATDRVRRVTVNALGPLRETFNASYQTAKGDTERRVDSTVEGVKTTAYEGAENVKALANQTATAVEKAPEVAVGIAKDVTEGAKDVAADVAERAKESVATAADVAKDAGYKTVGVAAQGAEAAKETAHAVVGGAQEAGTRVGKAAEGARAGLAGEDVQTKTAGNLPHDRIRAVAIETDDVLEVAVDAPVVPPASNKQRRRR